MITALTLVLVQLITLSQPSFAVENVAECVSKDVYDKGYVLRFDLNTFVTVPEPNIVTAINQIVPMWTLKQRFLGDLKVIRTEGPSPCNFQLVDRLEDPSLQIEFQLSARESRTEILKINGNKPADFTQLVCQQVLLERLAEICK